MLTLFNYEFSVEEFVTFIHAMEDNKLISQYYKPSTAQSAYVQLPYEVSNAFSMLEKNLRYNQNLKLYLNKFCNALVNATMDEKYFSASIETKQAKLLLVLLLSIDGKIVVEDETISLKEFADNAHLFLTFDPIAWLKAHDATLFSTFENLWRQFVPHTLLERNEKAKKAQSEREYQEKIQNDEAQALAKYFQEKSTYTFELDFLDMENVSYAIEGYIAQEKIQLFSNKLALFRPMLSQETSELLKDFNTIAQYKGLYLVTPDEIFNAFMKAMNSLVVFSSYEGNYQVASQKLLGFMLCHNFEIRHQDYTFKISELLPVWGLQVHLPQEWITEQAYPNKKELENLLQNQKRSFLPSFNQRQDFATSAEVMVVEEKPSFNSLFKC